MEQQRIERAQRDADHRPIAIVHDGMFIYANSAFLKLLGYENFLDLEAEPLFDVVVERNRERLRDHLINVGKAPDSVRALTPVKLTLLKSDGSHLVVIMDSHRSLFEGEEAIEFSLLTRNNVGLKNKLLRRPWKLYFSILFLFLLTVLSNGLLLNLNLNNSPKVYLPPDAPSVLVDDALREAFPGDQGVLLLFEGVALYSDGFLRAFHALAEALEADPLIDNVTGVTVQDHIAGTEEGFSVEPLIDVSSLDEKHPEERRVDALSDRIARGTMIAEDGSSLALLIIPEAIDNSLQRMALLDSIIGKVKDVRLQGYLTAMAGQIVLDVAQLRSMLRDNMTFIPATVFVGLLLIWWLFHRWIAVIIGWVVIGVVVSTTVAFYVLFNQPFNLISSIIPPLLSALTVAALVHLFNTLQLASMRGLSGPLRVKWALNEIRRPALYTCLTTAAGLASLGLSPIPPIKVFGLVSAAGVILIYFVVIHLVPNIFARFDFADWPSRRSGLGGMDAMVKGLLHFGMRYPVPVVAGTFLLLTASLPQIGNLVVETSLQEFFYPSHEVRRSTDHIEQKLVGTNSLEVVFTSPQPGGLKSPDVLNMMRDFQRWVESQPEVDNSISMADFVEEMNWGFHVEDDRFRRIPDDPKLISQYLLVYDGDDLFDFVDEEYRISRINLSVNVHEANATTELMERIRGYLQEHAGQAVDWDIAGNGRLFADQEDLLVRGQVYSLAGALGLIFLLMLLQWHSLGGALLCMIPNLSPILLMFIVMGAFGIWLDMGTAIIASVAVGIAVDDTIHVYHGFIHRVKQGISPVVALARTYRQAGRAVMTTTIILSAQFLVLVTSQFVPTAHFGLLTSIGLVAALLFDLVLLPAILVLIYSRKRRPLKDRKPPEV